MGFEWYVQLTYLAKKESLFRYREKLNPKRIGCTLFNALADVLREGSEYVPDSVYYLMRVHGLSPLDNAGGTHKALVDRLSTKMRYYVINQGTSKQETVPYMSLQEEIKLYYELLFSLHAVYWGKSEEVKDLNDSSGNFLTEKVMGYLFVAVDRLFMV